MSPRAPHFPKCQTRRVLTSPAPHPFPSPQWGLRSLDDLRAGRTGEDPPALNSDFLAMLLPDDLIDKVEAAAQRQSGDVHHSQRWGPVRIRRLEPER
jgi:hypothetical protein